jgi:hypothetical protein
LLDDLTALISFLPPWRLGTRILLSYHLGSML